MKKYTLSRLKGILSNGKWFFLTLKEKNKDKIYNIDIEICRADLNFSENKDKGEKYFLRIEKYDSKHPGDKGSSKLDKDKEFDKLEKVIGYLSKYKILKKEEWITKNEK